MLLHNLYSVIASSVQCYCIICIVLLHNLYSAIASLYSAIVSSVQCYCIICTVLLYHLYSAIVSSVQCCPVICTYSVHRDLTLEEFKKIFYMEYAHRMWGRMIGLAFFIPAGVFAAKGWMTPRIKGRVAFQGSILLFQVCVCVCVCVCACVRVCVRVCVCVC